MARTTTAVNGCDVSVWLDDATNTLRDISGSSNNVELNFDHDVEAYVTFQSKWPGRLECGKDATWTLHVIYSETANEGFDILKNWFFASSPGKRTCRVYTPDKNVGSDRYSGEFRIDSLNWSSDRATAGPTMVTAVLLPDGEVTHSDVAT